MRNCPTAFVFALWISATEPPASCWQLGRNYGIRRLLRRPRHRSRRVVLFPSNDILGLPHERGQNSLADAGGQTQKQPHRFSEVLPKNTRWPSPVGGSPSCTALWGE